jgi:DNA polymerase-3 subunit epsilon
MDLQLKRPLAVFDLETTGTNIVLDRMVEISIVRVEPNHQKKVKTMKINPGVPIPLEASLIHGIYDEDVKDAPLFSEIASELLGFIGDADLGGYNVMKFDIPILVEEILRSGIDFDISRRKIVDAQRLFFLMEKRNLAAAYKFYCGKTLENAHSAEADTLATVDVIYAMVQKYHGEKVEDHQGKDLGLFSGLVDDLHELGAGKFVDLAGRLSYNQQGEIVLNFGKHRETPVKEVFKKEPGYYDWMMRGDFPADTKRKITEIKLSMRS